MLTGIIIYLYKLLILLSSVQASIDGRTFMDPLNMRPLKQPLPGEDPCNPLYWYPRNIPEYCYYRVTPKPNVIPPVPVPLPVPLPLPLPHMPFPVPPMPVPLPVPAFYPPIPYGIPAQPVVPINPMYPYQELSQPQAAMVPGIPGLVSKDGGINILPFSDAYSDMLEKHKNKMIRRKLERLLHDYDDYPNRRAYRRLKKYKGML